MFKIRFGRLRLAAALLLGSVGMAAAEYPERAITLVYAYEAGSETETTVRSIATQASRLLGQPIVVENRPGAGGRLGADVLLRAAPDGYTIGIFNNAIAVNQPLLDPAMMIVSGKDYQPIYPAFETYLVLAARQGVPFKDIPTLIAYAKANPGKVTVGTNGVGTGGHLALELLKRRAGIDLTHVPYKGSAPLMTGVLSNEIDIAVIDAGAAEHVKSGKVIALGITGSKQWDKFPGTKTIAEQGVGGFSVSSYQGLVAPGGTPTAIIARLTKAFNEAQETQAVKDKLAQSGQIAIGGTPEKLGQIYQGDLVTWKPILEAIKAQEGK